MRHPIIAGIGLRLVEAKVPREVDHFHAGIDEAWREGCADRMGQSQEDDLCIDGGHGVQRCEIFDPQLGAPPQGPVDLAERGADVIRRRHTTNRDPWMIQEMSKNFGAAVTGSANKDGGDLIARAREAQDS